MGVFINNKIWPPRALQGSNMNCLITLKTSLGKELPLPFYWRAFLVNWLVCKQMRSRLCILETVKPLKMILDSAMASKMKNIYHKKTSLFYLEDGFHPKKTSWSLRGTKPLWASLHGILYLKNLGGLQLKKTPCVIQMVQITHMIQADIG